MPYTIWQQAEKTSEWVEREGFQPINPKELVEKATSILEAVVTNKELEKQLKEVEYLCKDGHKRKMHLTGDFGLGLEGGGAMSNFINFEEPKPSVGK